MVLAYPSHGKDAVPDLPDGVACRIQHVTITYRLDAQDYPAVSQASLDVPSGRITAIIGESGSGKSTLALSLLNGIVPPGRIVEGTIAVAGVGEVLHRSEAEMQKIRGNQIAMVFQAAMNTLNPLTPIGRQLLDLARSHQIARPDTVLDTAEALCQRMALDPARVLASYQHELSGGMRQRVNLIFALVLNPHLLVLDEPTTALDVVSQSGVLKIIQTIQAEQHLTVLLITHDLGVVAEVADLVAVMYAGKILERAPVEDLVQHPKHPYTRALIASMPRLSGDIDAAQAVEGTPPTLQTIPHAGCVFRDRCALRMDVCEREAPPLREVGAGHLFWCHAEVSS